MDAGDSKKFKLEDDRKVLEFLAYLQNSVIQRIVAVDREN